MEWAGGSVGLRAVEENDLNVIAGYLADPRLAGLRGIEGDRNTPMSRADLGKRIEDWARPQNSLVFCIEHGGQIVGHVRIDLWWDALCPNVDLVIAPDHRRRGYGAGAGGLILEYVFAETLAHTVQTRTPDWNEAGIEFARSLGFREAGRARRTGIRDGEYHDDIAFDQLRTEWEDGRRAANR
jgi:RimJ/RimL family protein N-acetyltransferase